jgi:hypothetical protein
VVVAQRLGELHEKNPHFILNAIAAHLIVSAPLAGDLKCVVTMVYQKLEEMSEMDHKTLASLRDVLLKAIEANRPVPQLMGTRLRNVLFRGLEGGVVDMFKDDATTAV